MASMRANTNKKISGKKENDNKSILYFLAMPTIFCQKVTNHAIPRNPYKDLYNFTFLQKFIKELKQDRVIFYFYLLDHLILHLELHL